jgi:hypothetical protein
LSALKDFVDNLPKVKQRASRILDFPEPLGPTITPKPASNLSLIDLLNDLNPLNDTSSIYGCM